MNLTDNPVFITHEEKIILSILAHRFGDNTVVENIPLARECVEKGVKEY